MREEHGQHHFATDRRTPHSLASAFRVPGGRSCPAAPVGGLFRDRATPPRRRCTPPSPAWPSASASPPTTSPTSTRPASSPAGSDFESSLRGALSSGETPSINGGTVARSLEPTNTNGNNVNLDQETVIATETGLRYQLALNALDGKYSLLRTALRTQ